jgi:KaiC/GvpD/RAD55 family RecA-like ATPase
MTQPAEQQERNPSMLMAALAYAKKFGWPVFPVHRPVFDGDGEARCSCRDFETCTSMGKHPAVAHGVKDATTDEATIRRFWERDPGANIGVAAGSVAGFFVLDVDPANGGDDSLLDLQIERGELPPTVEAITGSRGRHLLFRAPSIPIRNRVGFAPGLDTRSDGGYIVAAPSLHASRRRYAWEVSSRPGEVEIAQAPDWLLELVIGAPTEQLRDVQPIEEADLPELNHRLGRARRYLEHIPAAISGQGGHIQTFVAALALARGFALPESAALDLLAAEYNRRCQPPWSLKELEHKVASAVKDGRRPLGYLLGDRPLDVDGYEDAERASIQEEPRTAARLWLTPAERARRLGGRGIILPTGLETLDRAMRGGPATRKLVVLGGAPGAGKTTLVVQLARKFAKQGTPVAILAADEDADGLLVRWGQSEGIAREDLEAGSDEAREGLASALLELPHFLLVDAEEDASTVEDVSERLTEIAHGMPAVLVVDSLQTVRTRTSAHAESPRARIDGVVAVLKRAAKEGGHLVLATCELARGAYRSQNAADRIDDLAAFKESGGIEYGASALLVLRSVKGEEDLVDVTMPKNRMGQKLPFRLKLNFRLAEFSEVPMPKPADEEAERRSTEEARAARARDRVIASIRDHADLGSMSAVSRVAGKNKKENLDALRELLEQEHIAKVGGTFRIAAQPTEERGEP